MTSSLADSVVVLVRPQGPVNVGAVARLCANLGVAELRVVDARCDLDDPQVRQYAMQQHTTIRAFADLPSAVADREWVVGTSAHRRLRGNVPDYDVFAARAELAARRVRRLAVVFGNEAEGLRNDELASCAAYVRLATPGPYPSYNLSHAVAITLYVLAAAQVPVRKRRAEQLAATNELEHLFAGWLELLEAGGYFERIGRARFAPKLRGLLQRLHLSRHDVTTLWGMVTHLTGVLRSDGSRSHTEGTNP